jgi:hypothetical protein
MATNTLVIKDGLGVVSGISAFSGGFGLIPEHAINGTVAVTASAANPVYVTGAVEIAGTSTVTLSSNIVTASISGAAIVTASAASPVYVTGAVQIAGTSTVTLASNIVTSSIDGTVTVTSSVASPVHVTGATTVTLSSNIVTASIDGTSTITASAANPVYVTGGVEITNSPTVTLSSNAVTASLFGVNVVGGKLEVTGNLGSVTIESASINVGTASVRFVPTTTVTRYGFSSYGGPGNESIDWTSTASANVSGTFILASSSSARIGLMFANITDKNLYIAIGDTDAPTKNGFGMNSTASAPYNFSFILYPSGTYFAEPSFVNAKHSGFFVSSSGIDVSVNVYETTE